MISQPRSVSTASKLPSHGSILMQREVAVLTPLSTLRLQQVVQDPQGPVVRGLQGQLSQAVSRDKVPKQQEDPFQDRLPPPLPLPLPIPPRQMEGTMTTIMMTMIAERVGGAPRLARLLGQHAVVTVMTMVATVHLPNARVFHTAMSSVLEMANLLQLVLAAAASPHSDAQCSLHTASSHPSLLSFYSQQAQLQFALPRFLAWFGSMGHSRYLRTWSILLRSVWGYTLRRVWRCSTITIPSLVSWSSFLFSYSRSSVIFTTCCSRSTRAVPSGRTCTSGSAALRLLLVSSMADLVCSGPTRCI
ncbi:hypothetical protein B5807_04399 [Epicoccum nigrum]|uniref:Uncharacterized protein n=1 Tax=Epicoccum nigrum TaxID=105696 RepID=A0A1Y2M3V6_EPING|nr:hypothetical protein B5807_04399 [Epicoccum nigrum]